MQCVIIAVSLTSANYGCSFSVLTTLSLARSAGRKPYLALSQWKLLKIPVSCSLIRNIRFLWCMLLFKDTLCSLYYASMAHLVVCLCTLCHTFDPLNPSACTHVCKNLDVEKGFTAMLVSKRSAGVRPEVNLLHAILMYTLSRNILLFYSNQMN